MISPVISEQDRPRLDHDKGLRQRWVVRQRDMHNRLMPLRGQCLQPLECTTCQTHGWPPARQIDNLHVAPEHAVAQACSERFRAGLLGCEASGIRRRARRSSVALRALPFRKDAMREAVAMTAKHVLNTADIAKVGSDA